MNLNTNDNTENNRIDRLNGRDLLEEIEKEGYENISKQIIKSSESYHEADEDYNSKVDKIRNNPIYITGPKIRPKSFLPPRAIDEILQAFGVINSISSPKIMTKSNNNMTDNDPSRKLIDFDGSTHKKDIKSLLFPLPSARTENKQNKGTSKY